MTDCRQFHHGQLVTIDGSTAIAVIEGFKRKNDEPYEAMVRFTCDWRCMQFPIEISRLKPVSETQGATIQ
jgi:hypothetical protein